MLVVRFKVQCMPEKTEEMRQAMRAVVVASRAIPGVIHFDVAQDVTDSDSFIATEVFEDRAAMERQEAQPEVATVIQLIQGGAASGAPEWTIYAVASAESPAM